VRYFIEKMDCPTEEKLIRKRLEPLVGVVKLEFNLLERELSVAHTLSSEETITRELQAIDMGPRLIPAQGPTASPGPADSASWVTRHAALIGSGVLALGAEIAGYVLARENGPAVVGLAAGSVLIGGWGTLKKGFVALRTLTLNINFLMTIAIGGAMIIGQWPEAAMVTFLFGVAEAIEAASLDRARDAVRGLLAMTPPTAVARRDDRWVEVPADTVRVGEIVRVRPGERVPVDGLVRSGEGAMNQAAITGESLPVTKRAGDVVFAGTLSETGLFEVEVTAEAEDTTLAKVVRSIRDAQAVVAPTQTFVDRFARYYTPAVVVLAVLFGVVPPLAFGAPWGASLYRALVLLVIACPCALVISTPVTVVSALARAARSGILVKGGVYLEEARRLRVVAVDKTGTLTEGRPAVTDVAALGEAMVSEIERLAAGLESGSDHPIARAIVKHYGVERQMPTPTAFTSITGRGVEGTIDGVRYLLGSHRLAEERGVCSAEVEERLAQLEREGKSTIVLADERHTLGVLGVADPLRPTSVEAVRWLRSLGVDVVMLTGDNRATARSISEAVGVNDFRADLLPDDKVTAIEELLGRHGQVAMVGDGVNDAPALARATIGFAMGAAGTDTAIETADVALMQDDLRKLPELIELSRRTSTILRQNIGFAIAIKLVFFALSVAGFATLWMAVFADMGASLIVVANGLRTLKAEPSRRVDRSIPGLGPRTQNG